MPKHWWVRAAMFGDGDFECGSWLGVDARAIHGEGPGGATALTSRRGSPGSPRSKARSRMGT